MNHLNPEGCLGFTDAQAQAHQQLKTLLQRDGGAWPHQLTLSRLIGRSLRRQDKTLIRLSPDSRDCWWLGLLVPLCLQSSRCVLVLNQRQRERLLQVELPKLRNQGSLACWDGLTHRREINSGCWTAAA